MRKLIYKLQQHFGEAENFLCQVLRREHDLMIGFVADRPDVIYPLLTVRGHITLFCEVVNVADEVEAFSCTLGYRQMHENLATAKQASRVGTGSSAVTCFVVEV